VGVAEEGRRRGLPEAGHCSRRTHGLESNGSAGAERPVVGEFTRRTTSRSAAEQFVVLGWAAGARWAGQVVSERHARGRASPSPAH
jgi:hypothetical protein